jgi:hypothetical protein
MKPHTMLVVDKTKNVLSQHHSWAVTSTECITWLPLATTKYAVLCIPSNTNRPLTRRATEGMTSIVGHDHPSYYYHLPTLPLLKLVHRNAPRSSHIAGELGWINETNGTDEMDASPFHSPSSSSSSSSSLVTLFDVASMLSYWKETSQGRGRGGGRTRTEDVGMRCTIISPSRRGGGRGRRTEQKMEGKNTKKMQTKQTRGRERYSLRDLPVHLHLPPVDLHPLYRLVQYPDHGGDEERTHQSRRAKDVIRHRRAHPQFRLQ